MSMSDDRQDEEYQSRLKVRKKLNAILNQLQANREALKEDMRSNNETFKSIFEKIRGICTHEMGDHVRELNLDVVIALELANILKLQVSSLNEMSRAYNFKKFLDGLRERTGSSTKSVEWERIGRLVAPAWTCAAPLLTMHGPVKKQEKERKRKVSERAPKEKDTGPKEGATEVIQPKEDHENDEASNKRVVRLMELLEKRKNDTLDLLSLLVDPTDPVQTVENFFDFSFLVKERSVCVALDKSTRKPITNMVDQSTMPDTKRQMVLSLDMKDLEELPALLYGNELPSNPLHRDDELYTINDAYEQAEL